MKQINSASFFSNFTEIDKKEALLHFDNDFEIYFKIVMKYCLDGRANIAGIISAFNDRNFNEYIILVHALKSTTATIGNIHLSEHARKHEFAGKDNDYDYIEKDIDSLIGEYADFTNKLETFIAANCNNLQAASSRDSKKQPVDSEQLESAVREAIDAIDNFDIDKATDLLENLCEYELPQNVFQSINESLNSIEEYEYEDAIAILNSQLP